MPSYRFALRTTEPEPEHLGAMVLAGDREALAFGQVVAQELIEYAKLPPPIVVEVIEGERVVARIPAPMPN